MPIRSWPIDQSAFKSITFVLCEPKMAIGNDGQSTGIQATNRDGTEKRWVIQAVFSQVSRFDSNRTESEVKDVGITSAENPGDKLTPGPIWFDGLTAGAMDPEQTAEGRVRGGRIFLSAVGARMAAPPRSRGE